MSRHRRVVALLWALIQIALPTFATVADAEIARGASAVDTRGHVEDRTGPGCRSVHPPDCARCQALSTLASAVPTPIANWSRLTGAGSPTAHDARPQVAARIALPLSRAPPHLS